MTDAKVTKFEATSYCGLGESDVRLLRLIAEGLEDDAYRDGFLRACTIVGIYVEVGGEDCG